MAVITAYQLQALVLVDQLRVTLQAIERFDAQIAEIAPTLPDYALFKALPGAGPSLAPRLLAAFGEQRERFAGATRTPEVFRRRSGHRTQWQQVLGALALAVPDVPAANVR